MTKIEQNLNVIFKKKKKQVCGRCLLLCLSLAEEKLAKTRGILY